MSAITIYLSPIFAIFVMAVCILRLSLLHPSESKPGIYVNYLCAIIGAGCIFFWADVAAFWMILVFVAHILNTWKLWSGHEPPVETRRDYKRPGQ